VEIVEAEEGAAYGAALLAAVGAGIWPSVDAACAAAVRVASSIDPQPAAVAALNASYSAFRRVYPATRQILNPS
jgi:xylulokinase